METPSADQLQGFWKSRIVKYENADPNSLIPNPDNFKIHPNNQALLVDDIITELGWIQNVIVNVRTNHIIDGHLRILRAIEHGESSVPVTWVDIEEGEEAKAIALFDPTSQLAKQNRDAVMAAIQKITTNSKSIQDIVDKIAKRSKINAERFLRGNDDDDDDRENTGVRFADEVIDKNYRLINGECIEIMRQMEDKSVDSVIVDLPYNTTQAEWDSPIPLEDMWKHLLRIVKDNTMIVMFSAQPFTTILVGSNHKQFKYEIVWVKNIPTGFLNSNIRPMAIHENICIFSTGAMWYNPQMRRGDIHSIGGGTGSKIYGKYDVVDERTTDQYYPEDVVYYQKGRDGTGHPSEKPLDLMKYLVMTYSRKNETVLDFTMGSGTTGVAAIECGRKFIGIELDKKFFDIAVNRVRGAIFRDEQS